MHILCHPVSTHGCFKVLNVIGGMFAANRSPGRVGIKHTDLVQSAIVSEDSDVSVVSAGYNISMLAEAAR